MAQVRRVFAALVCAIAIGSFAALPPLSFAIVGSLRVVRQASCPIGWLPDAAR